jgi:hypothetical protein
VISRFARALWGGGRATGLRVVFAAQIVMGCYTYQPIRTATGPRIGDEVRVELTGQGTEELTRYLGPRVAALDAQVVRIDADSSLTLRVITLHFVDGTSFPFNGEDPVPVSRMLIGSTARRTLSPSRTVVASAGVVAGLIAVATAALHTGHVAPGGGPGGPPPP